jgi:lipoprotein NlpI
VTTENAELDKRALQNVTTKWKDVSAQLQALPQDKVIAHLKSDLEPYRRLFTYVLANKIEPLEYAKKLLAALNEKSKTE